MLHSIFAARCYAQHGLCYGSVVSVTFVFSVTMILKAILKLFNSPTILVYA